MRHRFLALLLVVVVGSARGEIRVVGYDLLGPAFTQSSLEEGLRHRCERRVAFDGNLSGASRLEAGLGSIGDLVGLSRERRCGGKTVIGGSIPFPCEVREEVTREWVADANRRPRCRKNSC